MREMVRSVGEGAGTATAVVALYLMLEEFLKREHVLSLRNLGFNNMVVLAVIWVVVATTRTWRSYAE